MDLDNLENINAKVIKWLLMASLYVGFFVFGLKAIPKLDVTLDKFLDGISYKEEEQDDTFSLYLDPLKPFSTYR